VPQPDPETGQVLPDEVAVEAIDRHGKRLTTGRFGSSTRDYKAMLGTSASSGHTAGMQS